MTRQKAFQLRALIEQAVASLSDTEALNGIELFPTWKIDVEYALGVRICYDGKLYKCVQAHTSQSGWEPLTTPALWTEVAPPGEILVWKQPIGAQDAYMAGDKVWYPEENTTIYICTSDYNIYAPGVFGWEVWTG